MTNWHRRTFLAPGLTHTPPGPHLRELARRVTNGEHAQPQVNRLYSSWAGTNQIRGATVDEHGNALGAEYDLIADMSISNARVAVLNLCSEVALFQPTRALERKGFTLVALPRNASYDADLLSDLLADAAELWVISDGVCHLTTEAVDAIETFFRSGRGLYVWGDNDPFFADANLILRRLFGIVMFGNSPGDQVVSIRHAGQSSGLVPGHLITTGLNNVYEGITIAEVPTSESLRPLIYGSNGRVVTAAYDANGCRAIIDGGFTRLYTKWDSAGTDRYVVNAAAWLLNIERVGDKAFLLKGGS